ncbi:MAG TPA: dihydroorotate dehydrogenase-like protein [Paludibacter sp.]|nr:dihydroorotate dehydrogenase-like protein [Paludibacter sp.]
MKNLKTKFMGIEISNPIVVGACNMTNNTDSLKKAEEMGAGAIVYKSLFEEQIQLERFILDEKLNEFNDIYAEMLTLHPDIDYIGTEEHLMKIAKAKESISIPLVASLNAVNYENWLKYASLLAETGVDGLELNFYQNLGDFNKSTQDIENEQLSIVKEIINRIPIPVSVKLSSDYTNSLNLIRRFDDLGVSTFVLFNAFFQPDINIYTEKHIKAINFSNPGDYRKSLKITGLLYDNIQAEICSSHGIFTGADTVRLILSGATSVQVVSTLYKNGFKQISKMRAEIEAWMESKNYSSLDDFRGKLSKSKMNSNPFAYKRAQYVDLLLNSEQLFENY